MQSRRRSILVIDDSPMFLELESLFLARSGRVFTASSGSDGLELARRERPDVVVVDMNMPGMGGDAVCSEIKADPELSSTPVVVITAREVPDDRARAIRAGADDVLSKPINRISLIQAVNRFVCFPEVRGLARVALDTRVRILCPGGEAWGQARNLSRGGMFIEAERGVSAHEEVELQFELPDSSQETAALSPTAKVIWKRDAGGSGRPGLGLQFLAIDRDSAEAIEAFVYERARSLPHPERPGASITIR